MKKYMNQKKCPQYSSWTFFDSDLGYKPIALSNNLILQRVGRYSIFLESRHKY